MHAQNPLKALAPRLLARNYRCYFALLFLLKNTMVTSFSHWSCGLPNRIETNYILNIYVINSVKPQNCYTLIRNKQFVFFAILLSRHEKFSHISLFYRWEAQGHRYSQQTNESSILSCHKYWYNRRTFKNLLVSCNTDWYSRRTTAATETMFLNNGKLNGTYIIGIKIDTITIRIVRDGKP